MAYPGFQREGCLRSGPIRKVGGGGGGALQVRYTKSGGALQVRYTKSGGEGGASGPIYEKWGGALQVRYTKSRGGASGPIYEKWGGGGGRFRSDIRKVAGGGGGHSAASGPIPLGTQKISTCTYLGILHTRARMNMPAKVNLL